MLERFDFGLMLKSQLITPRATDDCYRRLWLAVFEEALREYADLVSGEVTKARTERLRDMNDWIWGRGYQPAPFVFVCDAVGLDAEAVRLEILRVSDRVLSRKAITRVERPMRRLAAG